MMSGESKQNNGARKESRVDREKQNLQFVALWRAKEKCKNTQKTKQSKFISFDRQDYVHTYTYIL